MKKINLGTIFTYLVIGFAVAFAIYTAYTLLNLSKNDREKEPQSLFGYSFFVVLSGSMQEEMPAGSVIVTHEVDPETLKVNDIISFVSTDTNYKGEVATHKIRSIIQHEDELAFETYGTTTGVSDTSLALASNVIGKYKLTIPYLGNAIVFIQSKYGFPIFVIFPLAIIFLLQLIKVIKLFMISDEETVIPPEKKYGKKANNTTQIEDEVKYE